MRKIRPYILAAAIVLTTVGLMRDNISAAAWGLVSITATLLGMASDDGGAS